ncbi:MAG: hypothetical protein KBS60_03870 [Phascolarctobacterium sp.]|nr:hypothetical protein [Candidatus Phascolarctobacterium caballi]
MKILRMLLATALMTVIASTVFAKSLQFKVYEKSSKIVTAEETLNILPAKDIPDPNRPKKKHSGNNFSVLICCNGSKAWNSYGNVTKVKGGELQTDCQKIRLVVDVPGVTVCMERLQYWPGVEWYQHKGKVFDFNAVANNMYEVVVPKEDSQKFRLLLTKGDKQVCISSADLNFVDEQEKEILSKDAFVYGLEESEPMSHLIKVYAYWTARKNEDVRNIRTLYWRTIATSWSMVMGATAPLDEDGYYHSTEWFFDEFAYALFPEINWPDLRREDHVLWFSDRPEPYVIRRRTFDVNYVKILEQRWQDNQLIVTVNVKGGKKDKKVDIYLSRADQYKHPFAWKIDKGVIL